MICKINRINLIRTVKAGLFLLLLFYGKIPLTIVYIHGIMYTIQKRGEKTMKCKFCGRENINNEAVFCPECGKKIEEKIYEMELPKTIIFEVGPIAYFPVLGFIFAVIPALAGVFDGEPYDMDRIWKAGILHLCGLISVMLLEIIGSQGIIVKCCMAAYVLLCLGCFAFARRK